MNTRTPNGRRSETPNAFLPESTLQNSNLLSSRQWSRQASQLANQNLRSEDTIGAARSPWARRATALVAAISVLTLPALAWAAGDDENVVVSFVVAVINFAVFSAILYRFGAKPIANYFAERRAEITRAADEARERRMAAQARAEEFRGRLAGFDAEREAMLSEARQFGEKERDRIVQAASAQAAQIIDDAQASAEQEARRAQQELERRLVERALAYAREELSEQLDARAQATLIDRGIAGMAHSARASASI